MRISAPVLADSAEEGGLERIPGVKVSSEEGASGM